MIAAIRVRGILNCTAQVEATLRRLHLYRKNHAALLQDQPINRKTLAKVKDYITWGTADEETLKMLEKAYGKPYFRLNSPRKALEERESRNPFPLAALLATGRKR